MSTPGASAGEPLISASGICVGSGAGALLDHIDISISPSEIVTLIGPNGAGKTTLIRVLLGILQPSGGAVHRRPGLKIGYVPQHVSPDPVLPLTVERFLTLGGRSGGGRIERALTETGIERLRKRPLDALSGGELRRAVLARALLREPDLLILDEPVQGVDFGGQIELYELIGNLRTTRGCGVLLVSHDLHLVMAATDRVVCINRHLCCAGHPEAVSRHPEYLELFGARAGDLAIYTHDHDHEHDLAGRVVPVGGGAAGRIVPTASGGANHARPLGRRRS